MKLLTERARLADREALAEREAAEREAIAERVRGVSAACARCGVQCSTPTQHVVIVPDRVRGDGQLVFGQCDQCWSVTGNRDRAALAAVLRCDVKDRALDGVVVDDFTEMRSAHPDRPNWKPWDHLDTEALATDIERNRSALAQRACPAKQGCRYCGVSHTPPGTGWRRDCNTSNEHVCGSCFERSYPFDLRDTAAAVLVGFSKPYEIAVPGNLGAQLGIVFAHEAGVTKGADRPWAHVDVAAVRARNALLVAMSAYSVPGWSKPEKVGQVVW